MSQTDRDRSGRPAADAGSPLPRKTFECEFKSDDDAAGTFELYAACFGNVDRQGDIIEPGAFDNLAEFVRDGWIALNHRSSDLPVGLPEAATQDARGLLVAGRFHSTPDGQACRTVVRERKAAGKAVKCSIGYAVNDEAYEKRDGRTIRRIKKLSVYEVSFVNLPANPVAEVTSVKGATPPASEPPEEEPMSEPDKGVIVALKRALGLDAKRSVAISSANRAKIAEHIKAVEDAHEEMKGCHAEMKACHQKCVKCHGVAMKAMDDFKSYMKGFEPTTTDEDEEDEAGSPMGRDAEGDEEVRRPKKPKSELTQEQKDLAELRADLKKRAVAGRAVATCP